MNSELANLKALWSWASSNGANLTSIEPTVIMQDGEVQRTVRASSKIPNLQEIASIPLCILMSETKALASPVGKCLAAYFQTIPDQVEFQPARAKGLISLIVFMVYERFQMEKDSFFHPYLSTLPKDFPTLPFFYSDSELDAYIGKETNLVKTVRSKLLILRQGFDIGMNFSFLTFSQYSMLSSLYQTRIPYVGSLYVVIREHQLSCISFASPSVSGSTSGSNT
jgi:hypothetical protein